MNSLQNQWIFENLWKSLKNLKITFQKKNPVKEKPIVKIGWKWWWSIKEWVKRIETMDVNYFIINCIIPMVEKYTKTNYFWLPKRLLNSKKGWGMDFEINNSDCFINWLPWLLFLFHRRVKTHTSTVVWGMDIS